MHDRRIYYHTFRGTKTSRWWYQRQIDWDYNTLNGDYWRTFKPDSLVIVWNIFIFKLTLDLYVA